MENTPQKYIDRLREISGKKRLLLKDMVEITKKQSTAVHEDGIEELEKLVNQKQEIINSINETDDQFNVYFQRLKSELKVKSLDEIKKPGLNGVKELQEIIDSIMKMINEISTMEKQNSTKVKSLLDEFSEKIKKVSEGKKINSAYKPVVKQTASYFIDQKK
ncbi:MAG: flagellar protein FlgN [Clostridia bacterium]|nr:flagellar protein FlgN [Clostridia bacterium]